MSVERVFEWVCDSCKLLARRADYGLPRGWVFVKGRVTTHRCPECQQDLRPDQVGHPKVVAEK
jgi:hypothetical protein